MPKWLKIVLLVGGLTFLSFFAMCGACAYASYDLGKDVVEQAPQMMAEGERDALDTDQAGCLELALDRGVACEKMGPLDAGKCMALTQIYAKACFADAKQTEGFCDDLPEGGKFTDMVKWPVQRCVDLGREGHQSCAQIVQSILEHCGVTVGGQGARRRAEKAEGDKAIEVTPPPPPGDAPPAGDATATDEQPAK
jgi:hypothetical protein